MDNGEAPLIKILKSLKAQEVDGPRFLFRPEKADRNGDMIVAGFDEFMNTILYSTKMQCCFVLEHN